jgi:glutathione S-transferase
MARRLYELAGADPERRFSPYSWRARLALAHKGLEAEAVPWRYSERGTLLALSGQDKVPVLVDGDRVVADSWAIATYLEDAYPDGPSLFRGARDSIRFIAHWADAVLNASLVRLIVADIPPLLAEADRAYFRESRERRFGMPLEDVSADRSARLPAFRESLQPLRLTLRDRPYLGGRTPDYADYAAFSAFQWARCVSPFRLLEAEDPVHAWRERVLGAFDGLARRAPGFPC